MGTRTPMSRTEFFRFNPRWNDKDRAILEEDLEQFGGVSFEHSASGYPHVWVFDADGELLMHVGKGTIYYKGGRSRSGSEPYAPNTDTMTTSTGCRLTRLPAATASRNRRPCTRSA